MTAVIGAGLPIAEAKLEDVLNIFGRNLKVAINCVKIGTIKDIDYTTMTASIQIVFQKTMADGTYQTIKLLADCPVFTPQGGGFSLQFPIAVGDTAIVLFADRNIDNWFTSGGVMPPADGRLHALSDAIAIVGLNSLAKPLLPMPSSSGTFLVDKASGAKLGMTGGKLTAANTSGTLLAALQTLITGIQGATAGGNPLVDATGDIAAALTAFEALLNP